MSLFKKHHKLKAVDSFAFVGPAGEPPKPISDTEFSKAIHAPYAGKAWKVKKGTQTFIIQQYANPNKRGLWEIVNMNNMSRVMENAKLSDIKKYVSDTFGVKLVDKRIADRDFNVESVFQSYKYKPENKKYYVLYGNYSDNPTRKVFLFTANYDPVKKYSTGSGTILNSQQEVNNFIKEFGESIVRDELIQSSSKKALGKNIATEIKAGKDPKQAAAIAYSVQRANDKDINDGKRVEVYNQYQSIKPTRASVKKLVEKISGSKVVNEQPLNNPYSFDQAFHYKMSNGDIYDATIDHTQVRISKVSFGDSSTVKDAVSYDTILANWGFSYNGKGPGKIEYWKFRENDDKEYKRAIENIRQVIPNLIASSSNDGTRRITIIKDKCIEDKNSDKNTVKDSTSRTDALVKNKMIKLTNLRNWTDIKISTIEKNGNSFIVSQYAPDAAIYYNKSKDKFEYVIYKGQTYTPNQFLNTNFKDSDTINKLNDELGYCPEFHSGMDFTDIENIVHTTIQYIKAKYPNEENTMEKWLSLIGEEFGELCQAINDGEVNNVIEEGTQTIAAIYLMLSDFIINANVMASLIKE